MYDACAMSTKTKEVQSARLKLKKPKKIIVVKLACARTVFLT